MVTDYDCWREGEDGRRRRDRRPAPRQCRHGAAAGRRARAGACRSERAPSPIDTNLDSAIITAPDARDPAMVAKLDAICRPAARRDEPAAALCRIPRHPHRAAPRKASCTSSCRSPTSCSAGPAISMAARSPACSNSPPSARSTRRSGERGRDASSRSTSPSNIMRGGTQHDTIAAATVTRLGKRVANVEAHAWQLDRAKPIAAAQMNVLLRAPER